MAYFGCKTILVANRGEIACRIIRTARTLGLETVAIFSDADRGAPHVRLADRAVHVGESEAQASYLNAQRIIEIARQVGADCLHPGYGFLSENADFADAVEAAGVRFIGPRGETIRALGDKIRAKVLAKKHAVPTAPEFTCETISPATIKDAQQFMRGLGSPLLVKASAGGGGRGMRVVREPEHLEDAIRAASREAQAFFSDGRVFLEKLIVDARHIEVQILGDGHGAVRHFYDRDCTMQRRHQKVIEEAPAPEIPEAVRARIHDAALRLCNAVGYRSAGTVEFLLDRENSFYFLEVNSRLQVEHPVTEALYGVDLVALQIAIAGGAHLGDICRHIPTNPHGHAIEVRINAESPEQGFIASTGLIQHLSLPLNERVDTGYGEGTSISHYYDSLCAKVICHAADRPTAIERTRDALSSVSIVGPKTNVSFLLDLLQSEAFAATNHSITLAETLLPSDDTLHARRCVIAALVSLWQARHEAHDGDPWRRGDGWRSGQPHPIFQNLSVDGHHVDVTIIGSTPSDARVSCVSAGSPRTLVLTAITVEGSSINARLGAQPIKATLTPRGTTVAVASSLGPWSVTTRTPRLKAQRESAAAGTAEIVSPLPGKIVRVVVERDAPVKQGDALIVIESMKMEHIIRAPHDATVQSVAVKSGDVVESNRVLIALRA